MKDNIGIVGCGFVGKAVAKGFAQFADIKIYDVDDRKSTHNFEETINCDFVFLCLPTPMISAEGGRANLRILEGVVEKINKVKCKNKETIYVIKSTVPIGTTKRLSETYPDIYFTHNPEFLTARSAIIDFICPARNIVGYESTYAGAKVRDLLSRRFPGTSCFIMSSEESETVKYIANCFFATKVMFFNEMNLFIEKKGLSWGRIMEGVMADGRIGTSHYEVPGHDGDMGFGGTCVLPEAIVKICGESPHCSCYLDGDDILFPHEGSKFPHKEKTIEELYEIFHGKDDSRGLWIESCDYALNEIQEKNILDVTCRDIDEEIYVFEMEDDKVFKCTADHLMPVERNGKIILVKAKEIKESDLFFSKV